MLEQSWDFLDGWFYGYNDVNIEGLLIGGLLRSSNGKVLGSDEDIKLGLSHFKVIGYIAVNVY